MPKAVSSWRILWFALLVLTVFYVILELYYFYSPPQLITRLAEYGFPDLLGYVYKMLLLVSLLWISLISLRSTPLAERLPFYTMLSLGTLSVPLAIRMTLSIYSYTNYTAVFTMVALIYAIMAHKNKEPLLPRLIALGSSLLGLYFIVFPVVYYHVANAYGDPGVDALFAFITITPLSIVASLALHKHVGSWLMQASYGLLALATAGYSIIAEPLPGALEKPLASASIFVSLQSLTFLHASGELLIQRMQRKQE